MSLWAYLFTNIYMGAGIAADVYAATLGSFREFEDDTYFRNWIRRNSITHTVFPLVGMYLVVAGIAVWRPLTSILFSFGALLLGSFLIHLIRQKAGAEPHHEDSYFAKLLAPITKRLASIDSQWALVMGVSMDAINSGFAKAADAKHWSLGLLMLSFPLVGCVVGAGAWAGGKKAKWFLSFLKKASGTDAVMLAKRLARLEAVALTIEMLVLGYFFWRSVASAFEPFHPPDWLERRALAWEASAITLLMIVFFWGRTIYRNIHREASKSFEINSPVENAAIPAAVKT